MLVYSDVVLWLLRSKPGSMLRQSILFWAMTTACFGQRFEFGAKGGIPATSSFGTSSFFTIDFGEGGTSATRRYVVGPTIELKLPHGFGLEFDALYRRLGFDELEKSAGVLFTHIRTTAGSWDFPLLGKYRFRHFRSLTPFVDGGVSFRHASGISTASDEYLEFYGMLLSHTTSNTSATLDARSTHGGVVGLGAESRLAFLHISPEVRYTRWGADAGLQFLPAVYSSQNQVDVLLGITF